MGPSIPSNFPPNLASPRGRLLLDRDGLDVLPSPRIRWFLAEDESDAIGSPTQSKQRRTRGLLPSRRPTAVNSRASGTGNRPLSDARAPEQSRAARCVCLPFLPSWGTSVGLSAIGGPHPQRHFPGWWLPHGHPPRNGATEQADPQSTVQTSSCPLSRRLSFQKTQDRLNNAAARVWNIRHVAADPGLCLFLLAARSSRHGT